MKARFFIVLLCFATKFNRIFALWTFDAVQRVINGIDTNIEYHPYMVSLEANGRHMCGGAIINNGWVLTAAQCIERVNDPLKEFTLRSSCSTRNDESCVSYNVSNFYVHEKFNAVNIDYDIAVIQVIPRFTYDDRTKAVDLPPDGDVSEEWGTVCGWGYYSGDSGGPLVNIENILLGITSWGYCTKEGLPGVYTDVTLPEFKQWIKEKTGMD